MVKFLQEKSDLTRICAALSLFTLVAFHGPFFRFVLDHIEGGGNGVWITASLAILMLALNFFVYYLVLFLGRIVGKCILAFTFIGCIHIPIFKFRINAIITIFTFHTVIAMRLYELT